MSFDDRWFLLYAQIVGIQHHPKNNTTDRMTPDECVAATDHYMKGLEGRFPPNSL